MQIIYLHSYILMLLFQGYTLATQLGHSIIEPVPSLFTFKIDEPQLAELSGVMVFLKLQFILQLLLKFRFFSVYYKS